MRGKFVILLMIAVAIALSGYAWWHQFQAGRHSAEFWGSADAVHVRYAPRVEFLPLRPHDPTAEPARETLAIRGIEYVVGDPVDVTGCAGWSMPGMLWSTISASIGARLRRKVRIGSSCCDFGIKTDW